MRVVRNPASGIPVIFPLSVSVKIKSLVGISPTIVIASPLVNVQTINACQLPRLKNAVLHPEPLRNVICLRHEANIVEF